MSWYPNCGPCCESVKPPSCINWQDDFDYVGTFDLTKWISASANWTADGTIATCSVANSQAISINDGHVRIAYAQIRGTATGDQLDFIGSIFGAFSFKIRNIFGTNGFLNSISDQSSLEFLVYTDQLPVNDWVNVVYCEHHTGFSPDRYSSLTIYDSDWRTPVAHLGVFGNSGSSQQGIESGSQINGSVDLEFYRLSYTRDSQSQVPNLHSCPECLNIPWSNHIFNGIHAQAYLIRIEGVEANNCPNTDCEDQLNGTYNLEPPNYGIQNSLSVNVNLGQYYCQGGPTTFFDVNVYLTFEDSLSYGDDGALLRVRMTTTGGYEVGVWTYDFDHKPTLAELNNFELNYSSSVAFGPCKIFFGTGRCWITAVP